MEGGRNYHTFWAQPVRRGRRLFPRIMIFVGVIFLVVITGGGAARGQDGKVLFMTNCAQCHNPIKVVTGPALKGVTERVGDTALLHAWIHNNQKVLATGNVYFNNLYNQYGKAPMNTFPGLSDAEIDAILSYVNNYAEPLAATNTSNYPSAVQEDHTVLFGIVSAVLAAFVFGLYLVNNSLKKLADERRGLQPPPEIPVYRNKVYVAAAALLLFVGMGYWMVKPAVALGRSKGYQPEQPIFFSHRVHAGLNQISCLLCHGNATEGKQASVPSLNVCMNCHAAINEYKGERLERANGDRVDPNEQLHTLYSYTGYDPAKGRYTHAGRPVEWVRIHNLPDHVFFSHAQHTRVGGVACQTCHGPVQEMDEVRQFADLSMGWCINCHRTTSVPVPSSPRKGPNNTNKNQFYSMYKGFVRDLQSGKIDSVTVEQIGGTECQKCHY